MASGYCSSIGWIGAQALIGQVLKGSPVHAGRMGAVIRVGALTGPPLTGAAWDEFVSGKGLESLALPLRKLDAPPALTNLADAVFAFPRPAEGQVGSGGIALGDGGYVLFIVEEVTNALPDDVDEALKTSLTQQLVSRDGNELYNQFSQMLRDKAEIMVYEDQL